VSGTVSQASPLDAVHNWGTYDVIAAAYSTSDNGVTYTQVATGPAAAAQLGDGRDGALTVSGLQRTDQTRTSCTGTAGASTLSVASITGFSVGDLVLALQMRGPGAGQLEERTVSALGGTTLTLNAPLSYSYSNSGVGRAVAIRVPQYTNVTVNTGGTLTASAWDGTTGGVLAFHQTYRRSTGRARERLQLLGCAVAVIVEVVLVAAALHLLVDWPAHWTEVAAGSSALVPLALAAGTYPRVLRRVDRVLVHTVSATGLTAVVVGVYVVVVIGLGRAPADTERTLLVLSMAAAAVAALLYVPARERLEESANRLVYGERHAPDEVLRTWGSRLSRSIPMDELLLQLAESLRKVLVLQRAEVWTGKPERLELAVSVPDRAAPALHLTEEEQPIVTRAGVTGNAWLEVWLPALLEGRSDAQLRVAPAAHSGELLGLLVVQRAADADVFTEEDDRVLTELARQVGLALHNVQLDSALQESLAHLQQANDDLQASRARIVATGDAERRKIERNLHDGAQQHLVALAVNLRLAKDILSEDPDGAAEMLDALGDAVKDTIQELRDLAHGIYPPLLMDSGLPEALRAAGGRSPLSGSVETGELGRYPTELEAAVYFCCLEALQTAAMHAPGASVVLTVLEDDGAVRFTVSDDGPGFDVDAATAGHGYVNMNDRVGAIGGSVEWRSVVGEGATIAGTVPLR
jgi:signal transduction histidine kinase